MEKIAKRRKSIPIMVIILEVLAVALLLIFFFPFAMVIINSAKTGTEVVLTPLQFPNNWGTFVRNVNEILTRDNIDYFRSFANSIIITVTSLLTIGIFSAMAAWVLVRTKTKYSFAIFMFFLAGMVIPFQVVMLPLVRLLQDLRSLTGIPFRDTFHGVILAYMGFGAPLSVFLFHGFIKSIPIDIEEAAIIDGCSKPQVFFRIVLPVLKPIFVTLLVLNGMWIWNDYLLPVLIIGLGGATKTLPLAVANLAGFYDKEWGLILTSVLMAAAPVLILFLFAQKHIIKGMTSGAVK
ncbi:MAG: carbohydrate ABC transporter permease [Erysipelothrix sp.]|jgi:raffinose/stachyose/melibiose transport system permease protein|nr:carbohydrate ABC transporter permease [Erysipelothrix sp.]